MLSAAMLPGLAALWLGCSVEKHYELLSFFFDGVPDPNAPEGLAPDSSGRPRRPSVTHPPFKEGACTTCHVGAGTFGLTFSGYSSVDADVCFECHEGVLDEHPLLHGPVAIGGCILCHEPHVSRYEHLLTAPTPRLCIDCHGTSMRSEAGGPHEDLERDCLDCHDAHGGRTRYFLRELTETEESEPEETEPEETEPDEIGTSRLLRNSDGPTSASFRPDRTVDSRRITGDMPSNRRHAQDESSLDLGRAGVPQQPASDAEPEPPEAQGVG
ncbi:MAG: hypothetical protein GY715_02310 [Planctomycetes bacterium]|nr:hypothetical protein [Planctomycetota bacterium]